MMAVHSGAASERNPETASERVYDEVADTPKRKERSNVYSARVLED